MRVISRVLATKNRVSPATVATFRHQKDLQSAEFKITPKKKQTYVKVLGWSKHIPQSKAVSTLAAAAQPWMGVVGLMSEWLTILGQHAFAWQIVMANTAPKVRNKVFIMTRILQLDPAGVLFYSLARHRRPIRRRHSTVSGSYVTKKMDPQMIPPVQNTV